MSSSSANFSKDTKFASFWQSLTEKFELPEDLKPNFYEALKTAGYYNQPTVLMTAGAQVTEKPKKKLSGYNLFMREKSAELKSSGADSSERMKQVAGYWKQLTEVEKAEWKEKASNLDETGSVSSVASTPSNRSVVATPTTKSTKAKKDKEPRALTGYQYYVQCTMPEVLKDDSLKGKERMKKIAEMWGGLAPSEKEEFKVRAQALGTASDEEAIAGELEEVEELVDTSVEA